MVKNTQIKIRNQIGKKLSSPKIWLNKKITH